MLDKFLKVGAASGVNFFLPAVFLPLAFLGNSSLYEVITNAVIVLSFMQVLEACRYPVVVLYSSNPSPPSVLRAVGSSVLVFWLLFFILLSVTFLFERIGLIGFLVFSVSGFASLITSAIWGVLDSQGKIGEVSMLRALSNAPFFLYIGLAAQVDVDVIFYLAATPSLNFLVLLSIFFWKRILELLKAGRNSSTTDNDVSLLKNVFGIFSTYSLATLAGNLERLIATNLGLIQVAYITYLSEMANRASFFPRMIYSIMLPNASRGKGLSRWKKMFKGGLILLTAVSFLYILIVPFFILEKTKESFTLFLFVYFFLSVLSKFISYVAALHSHAARDFYAQPAIQVSFVLLAGGGYLSFLGSDYDPITIFILVVTIAKFSEIVFCLYSYLRYREV